MLELENQFLALKKRNMSIYEYTNAFSDKIEFSLCIFPDKISNIDRHAKRYNISKIARIYMLKETRHNPEGAT